MRALLKSGLDIFCDVLWVLLIVAAFAFVLKSLTGVL